MKAIHLPMALALFGVLACSTDESDGPLFNGEYVYESGAPLHIEARLEYLADSRVTGRFLNADSTGIRCVMTELNARWTFARDTLWYTNQTMRYRGICSDSLQGPETLPPTRAATRNVRASSFEVRVTRPGSEPPELAWVTYRRVP